ncbi:MAG: hypothetical protein KDJ52_31410 [Anaerolineae bacterium]|nr:hypothetical protein [Anaerolineae bacterium]
MLKLRQAQQGIETPPQIVIEIEDIEKTIEEIQTELTLIDEQDVESDYDVTL